MKQKFWKILVVFCGLMSASESHGDFSDYKSFVEKAGNEIIQILVDQESPLEVRKKKFQAVLQERFSLPSIAKFVLARYWRRANDAQKVRYLGLFEEATVENYATQFDSYNNESLKVLSAQDGKKNSVIVSTNILRPSGADPLKVNWHVAKTKSGQLKVIDLVINGVSMSITQRSEYGSMVQSAKGNLDKFLDTLEAQIR